LRRARTSPSESRRGPSRPFLSVRRAQERFCAVEINSTAYALPSPATVAAWRARSGRGFRCCLKAPAAFTHAANPRDPSALSALTAFLARAYSLGAPLGPLLLQFPRSVAADAALLEDIAAAVEEAEQACGAAAPAAAPAASPATSPATSPAASPALRIALEVRHASWLDPQRGLADWLRQRGWALVAHPDSMGRATVEQGAKGEARSEYPPSDLDRHWPQTAPFAYVRLHGGCDDHAYDYGEDELRRLAAVVHGWRMRGIEVWAFVLNDSEGAAMPRNAEALKRLAHEIAGEPVPRPPKAAAATLAGFFRASPSSSKRQKS